MGIDSDRTARIGVHGVANIVLADLGWIFREQHESDFGIDAHIEAVADGRPTGMQAALQIKSGPFYFSEAGPSGGWVVRGPKRHLTYWLENQLPVIIVLFDPRTGRAYWQHVNPDTAVFSSNGYRVEIPASNMLAASAKPQIKRLMEHWTPLRGSSWSHARNAIGRCLAAGVPVLPTSQMWDAFTQRPGTAQPRVTATVLTYNLPLTGSAPAVAATAAGGIAAELTLGGLRGTWQVAPGTSVFVCENPLVIRAAATRLGPSCRPLVCLLGNPGPAVEYLLLGIGFCMAKVLVHTDHDDSGTAFKKTLFSRTIDYEDWCPSARAGHHFKYEEECLEYMLTELLI